MTGPLNDAELAALGFNLQGVVPAAGLTGTDYSQLLVFAHGGSTLWRHVAIEGDDPIDRFSIEQLSNFMARIGVSDYEFLYPGADIDLLAVGERLGWYHISPLGIGINPVYGTWFAFRGVIAASTRFAESERVETESPCISCDEKPCVSACPVGAVQRDGAFLLDRCIEERSRRDSDCAYQCLARLACPVGSEHRYSSEQVNYHYRRSLASILASTDKS